MCPVLFFTPEVNEALDTFHRTHEVVVVGNTAVWRRAILPDGDSLADQDVLLMQAVDVVRGVMNRQLARAAQAAPPSTELAEFREQHGHHTR